MKKILSLIIIGLLCFSMLSVITPEVHSDETVFETLKRPGEEYKLVEATQVPQYDDGEVVGYKSYTVAIYHSDDLITGSAIRDDSSGQLLSPSDIWYSMVEVPAVVWFYGLQSDIYSTLSDEFYDWADWFKGNATNLRLEAIKSIIGFTAFWFSLIVPSAILTQSLAYFYETTIILPPLMWSLWNLFRLDPRTILVGPILAGVLLALADIFDGGLLTPDGIAGQATEVAESFLQLGPSGGSWEAAHNINPTSGSPIFKTFWWYRVALEIFYHNDFISFWLTEEQKQGGEDIINQLKNIENDLMYQSQEIDEIVIAIWSKARTLEELRTLAVTPAYYDNMQSVLNAMGYSYSNIPVSTLADLPTMEAYDVVFINCAPVSSPGSTFAPIREFVNQGGAIYASDWAYEYVEGAFPEFADFGGHIAPAQTTTGNIVDAGLQAYVGSETMNIVYDLGIWVPLTYISDEVTVYVTNTVSYSGQTHEDIPTVIGFKYGNGYVVYTSFHHAAQDELARRLMEYLVLLPTTTDLRIELEDAIEEEGYSTSATFTDSVNEEETKSYSYSASAKMNLIVGVNWYGSIIEFSATQPDGAVYCTESSWTPPIVSEIPDADPGTWTFMIKAIEIPYPNYPVVLLVGVPMDVSPPSLSVKTPSEDEALQDGVTLDVLASDPSGVDWVTFSIREPNGEYGIVIDPEFESMPATHICDAQWQLAFDTTQLPDGYYRLLAKASDTLGNEGNDTVDFTIRNWAYLELLPASESNKAGRTMPVKFSLRVVEVVDPAQPFVWNEELTIRIYEKGHPENILQESTLGETARDYRIDSENEHYTTNFRTIRKKPKTYVVEIYRKDLVIGSFEFSTVE